MDIKTERIKYSILFILFLIIEIIIALFIKDNFIRPYVGDMLVVILLYCLVRIVIPIKYKLLPIYIFLFAIMVEISQYFNIVKFLGLEDNRFFRILIGSVFDVKDIISYGVGCVLLLLYQWKLEKKKERL